MDIFEDLERILTLIRKFADLDLGSQRIVAERDYLQEGLLETFLQCQSSLPKISTSSAGEDLLFEFKDIQLYATHYNKPLSKQKNEQSGESCIKTSQNVKLSDQRWLRKVSNELSWVGMSISKLDDSIEQLIKEGKQSLADIKLILMMTSRLTFIHQLNFLLFTQNGKNQEQLMKVQGICKKYIDFLTQTFQKQLQIRSVSLSKGQEQDYIKKVMNAQQYRAICKLLNINIDQIKES